MKKEYIKHEKQDQDAWICKCGNTPSDAGFYPCDKDGQEVEPTPKDWTTNCYLCNQCGSIINQDTLEIVGVGKI